MEVEGEVEGTRTVMVAGSFFWGRRLSRVALEAGRREAAWGGGVGGGQGGWWWDNFLVQKLQLQTRVRDESDIPFA